MSFGEAIRSYFKNYVNFKGRARRSEFWYAVLFYSLVSAGLSLLFPGTEHHFENLTITENSPIVNLWDLATLLPGLGIIWRRLHDVSKPGPYFFFILIPIAGAIMLLIQLVKDSTPGANVFGEPVK